VTWSDNKFNLTTQDLWENEVIEPNSNQVFTYSLAMAAQGLKDAASRLRNQGFDYEIDEWDKTRERMLRLLAKDHKSIFHNKISGEGKLDSSLSGLAYPLEAPESLKDKIDKTVLAIGKNLLDPDNGIIRYEGDTYDGIARPNGGESTAGSWPLLSFWHAIALNRIGQRTKALGTYYLTLERLSELYDNGQIKPGHIPEQIFKDDARQGKGVTPLAWSHAKFALATVELGL
jgi:GH15 family glucan-1,4-alpha-glucosidase